MFGSQKKAAAPMAKPDQKATRPYGRINFLVRDHSEDRALSKTVHTQQYSTIGILHIYALHRKL